MRIGFLTYGMHDRLTGIGCYTRELTYALRHVDPTLEIILLNPYPRSPLPWYRDFPGHPVPSLKFLPAVTTWGSPLLERACRSLRLDVLHDPCGIAPFLAPRSRTRRVVTVHDAIPYLHPEVQPLLTRLVFRTLIPAARWTADAIVTVSESARRDLVRHIGFPGRQVHVVYPGVAMPETAVLQADRSLPEHVAERYGIIGPYFLSVGALSRRKNLSRLLEAFAIVRARHPATQLVVAGPGRSHKMLEAARRLGDAVRLTGFVCDEDLHVLYAGATALVYPSIYEGFGLPVLEAMARGLPVITSATASLPEVVGDAGLLVEPTDTEAIAHAMERVLLDRPLTEELSRRGRRRAERFTWDATAAAMLEIYDAVCAGQMGS